MKDKKTAFKKKRLDVAVCERGLADSRQRAQALILAGKVLVNNVPIMKSGAFIRSEDELILKGGEIPYVSRGGVKLAGALDALGVSPEGCICLDIGASTGGFTDCLLQRGAQKVYAVDVGYGQLAWKLQTDSRVVSLERTNFRYMDPIVITDSIDLIVIDVSFISLKYIIPVAAKMLSPNTKILPMMKPQFEVGREDVGNGVITDPALHQRVLDELTDFFEDQGFSVSAIVPSPILGPKGNTEFFTLLQQV